MELLFIRFSFRSFLVALYVFSGKLGDEEGRLELFVLVVLGCYGGRRRSCSSHARVCCLSLHEEDDSSRFMDEGSRRRRR
ncbi:hypothetical protein A4A49_15365 [Nicotiana attenuata]|uniref:Secreted protein n=1 Tax=Nicotiana attenuata TaxID=49451 RepID=A0A1J6IRS7_NICAT|nr:hypothetical protein A4A49_15365 [Nicotiana attenuata]